MIQSSVIRVREYVREVADRGGLGVLAARVNASEGDLRRWLDEMLAMPSEALLEEIETVRQAHDNGFRVNDPYNSCAACDS